MLVKNRNRLKSMFSKKTNISKHNLTFSQLETTLMATEDPANDGSVGELNQAQKSVDGSFQLKFSRPSRTDLPDSVGDGISLSSSSEESCHSDDSLYDRNVLKDWNDKIVELKKQLHQNQQLEHIELQVDLKNDLIAYWELLVNNEEIFVPIPIDFSLHGSRTSFVKLLNYAEKEQKKLYLFLDKNDRNRQSLIRTFLFVGFSIEKRFDSMIDENMKNYIIFNYDN
ncbi:hypothetical protein SNEBB_010088 [Seison nebaliae]|nr:hypothetical protein SNEBB_010088 [Seison nebaliae]